MVAIRVAAVAAASLFALSACSNSELPATTHRPAESWEDRLYATYTDYRAADFAEDGEDECSSYTEDMSPDVIAYFLEMLRADPEFIEMMDAETAEMLELIPVGEEVRAGEILLDVCQEPLS